MKANNDDVSTRKITVRSVLIFKTEKTEHLNCDSAFYTHTMGNIQQEQPLPADYD